MNDGKPAILVVEDEPVLLLAAVDMVENAGFEAVEASDATEAVRILENRSDICIVFTDISMPRGMNGVTLAESIRRRWPPIEIIFTSGRFAARDIAMPRGSLFFAKPYRERDVVAAFRRMAA